MGLNLIGQLRPKHVKRSVREVDDTRHAKDQGEARGDEKQEDAFHQALQNLDK